MPYVSHAERARRRAAGLCTRCLCNPPKPSRKGKHSCAECAKSNRRRAKKDRAAARKRGRCLCGRYRRLGRIACRECAALEFVKAHMKMELLLDMGICTKCMERPARLRERRTSVARSTPKKNHRRATYIDCVECFERRLEQRRKRTLSKLRAELLREAQKAEREALDHD